MLQLNSFCSSVVSTAKRFPVSTVLIVLTLVWDIMLIADCPYVIKSVFHNNEVAFTYSHAAVLLSITFTVMLERICIANVWKVLINCALLGVGAYISHLWGSQCVNFHILFSPDDRAMILSAEIAFAVVILFCLPFWRKGCDRAYVNYAKRSVWYGIKAFLIFALVFVLYLIGLFACETLFDIYDSGGPMLYAFFVCLMSGFFYLLTQFKSADEIYDNETIGVTKACKVLGYYIFLPFTAIYSLILYVYAIKSVVTLSMPDAPVTWMVSGLFALCIVVMHLLYDEIETNKVAAFFARWAWAILLPVVVMMTVGLAYRINQYGITIWRAVDIVYNVWLYAVLVFLFITRSKRIKWVLISFGVVAILSSLGPWSIPNVVLNAKYAEMQSIMKESGYFEGDGFRAAELEAFVNSLPKDKAHRFAEDYNYLFTNGGFLMLKESCVDCGTSHLDSYFIFSETSGKYDVVDYYRL